MMHWETKLPIELLAFAIISGINKAALKPLHLDPPGLRAYEPLTRPQIPRDEALAPHKINFIP
eukprot:16603-Pyramimonas_sp.AAC.1